MTAGDFALAADGARIHWRADGPVSADTVLFSHSLGVTLDTWDAQVRSLDNRWRVVRYDARGHGRSDAPGGPYELAMLAADALAVLDAADVATAHVVGLSMGGMVGMWLAAHRPDRVGRLVLANTTAHIPLRDMWNSRIETALSVGMGSIASATLQRWVSERFKTVQPEAIAAIAETMRTMSPAGYAGCCAALRDADQRATVGAIAAPALVLTGAADQAITPAVAEALAAAIPGARCAIVPDAGHLSNIEQPEAFNALIRSFLA